ncbi:stage II sporulation protein E [Alicyclobacillus contaminans]|uniref:stage II sporulation protein E n=1 Tax=Alicyclobacillus contaminans TaxID=392016 RepID=UPI000401382E|nr:stage II sporulation protein E [Alicyclobacillus contaminans]GMA50514.1 stage II sporulation protein E [Alicyclobacillus contaminans]
MSYTFAHNGGQIPSRSGRRSTAMRVQLYRVTRTVLLLAVGVLLGRASIEHVISPFALAYYVILSELVGAKRSWPAYAAVVGAFWHDGSGGAALLVVDMLVYRFLRRVVFAKRTPDLHWLPFLAGMVDTAGRLAAVGTVWTRYDLLLAFAEGALVILLSLIFIQCLPLFTGSAQSRRLKHEQLVCLTILLGSVMTGLAGLNVQGIPLLEVGADWVVLVLAAAGGAGMGATVAVVVGVLALLNHAQSMSAVAVLAFAGLLSGVLKDARRVWSGLAFAASLSLLTAATNVDWSTTTASIVAAGAATLLYWLTPQGMLRELATFVPGTVEHSQSEQERTRRIRQLLTEKIDDMGAVFEELAVAFADTTDSALVSDQQLLDYAVGSAAKAVCAGCPLHEKCWDKESYATYQAMVHTVEKLERSRAVNVQPSADLKERCIRVESMMGVLRYNLDLTDRDAKWIEKLREQRSLVSAQLSGVANVIRDVVSELNRSNESSLSGEEQILAALERLGLYIDHVHIVSLEPGKIEIEVSQPSVGAYENSVRMIAPLLSGAVGENITLSHVVGDESGPCTSVFTSARLFQVDTAVATVARDGRTVSGDTYTAVDLDNGRFALAVSDGMGNGERARRESKAAIELLKKLLKAGFDEQLAIKTVNSTLLLRSRDEMFTTMDMALIDLYSARAEFLKIGSAPSFVKRGSEVFSITGTNVPIGILQDIEVQTVDEQLYDGDLLILVSDGIYDAPQHVYDKEDWLKRQIERLETADPQEIADTLVEAAVRMNHGQIFDDMTVLVAAIKSYQPEWASIKLPGITGLRRDKKKQGA